MATIRENREAKEAHLPNEAPVNVRLATGDDRAAALALIAAGPSALTARGRASLALLRAGQGTLWVATERADAGADAGDAAAEKLVGLLLATAQIDAESQEVVGYIHELLVHPAYRRRGAAMRLLDAAEHYFLAEHQFALVSVATSFDNDAAMRLYRSRGYTLSQVRLTKARNAAGDEPSADGEPSATDR